MPKLTTLHLAKLVNLAIAKAFYFGALAVIGVRVARIERAASRSRAMKLQEVWRYQRTQFSNLSRFARDTSKLYGDLYASGSAFSSGDVNPAALPPLDKGRLSRVAKSDIVTGKEKIVASRSSSGTTGQPVRVYLSKSCLAEQLGSRAAALAQYGLTLGERELRLWRRPPKNRTLNRLKNYILNRRLIDASSVRQLDRRQLERIVATRPDYIYGYSSLVVRLAQRLRAADARFVGLKAVICTAESLLPDQIEVLRNIFGCPVHIEYGCSEVDIIASTCVRGVLHVDMRRIFLETLPHEHGFEEAIVTDLRNFSAPIIRYKLGDALSVDVVRCACGIESQVISSLTGRTQERFLKSPEGDDVHCSVLPEYFKELADAGHLVLQWRVTQQGYSVFYVEIDASSSELTEVVRAHLKERLEFLLGRTIRLVVDAVEGFEDRERKFSYFISMRDGGDVLGIDK
jgi:phenylacetate-CoA ligase